MKVLLTYLLTACLFFVKGYSAIQPVIEQHSHHVLKNNQGGKVYNNAVTALDITDWCYVTEDDGDEDEEHTSSKKKQAYSNCIIAYNAPVAISNLQLILNNSKRFYKHFYCLSTPGYILHRKILV